MNEESSSGSSHSDSDTGSDDGDEETHDSEKKLSTILKKKNDGKDSNGSTSAAINSSDEEEYSIPDEMQRQLNIPICENHGYPTTMSCCNVSFGTPQFKRCGRPVCKFCVLEREDVCRTERHLQDILHLVCYAHFNHHMKKYKKYRKKVELITQMDQATEITKMYLPFFESATTNGSNFNRGLYKEGKETKVESKSEICVDDDGVDDSWYNVDSYLDDIIEHGAAPPAVEGVKYRQGKITNAFIQNVIGLVLWKRMCGRGNLRWPKESDLQSGGYNVKGLKELMLELRKKKSEKFDEIAEVMDLKSVPMFDAIKLHNF